MDVTVCIATYGDTSWVNLAHERAIPSAQAAGATVVHRHATTLAAARNEALALADTEWVIHLDADDELEPGYVEAMSRGSADVRGPIARYVRGLRKHLWQPRVAGHTHECTAECLVDGNWLLVGAAIRTELVHRAGGWREWPVYEDWDLFLRCHLLGASFELIRDAVYRAHVRPDSRNRAPSMQEKNRVHREITQAVLA